MAEESTVRGAAETAKRLVEALRGHGSKGHGKPSGSSTQRRGRNTKMANAKAMSMAPGRISKMVYRQKLSKADLKAGVKAKYVSKGAAKMGGGAAGIRGGGG